MAGVISRPDLLTCASLARPAFTRILPRSSIDILRDASAARLIFDVVG